MSDLARLAALIETTSDSALAEQIARYVDANASPGNQFALSSLLLSKRALEARIRRLSAANLADLIAGKSNAALRELWLADDSSAFAAAVEHASDLLAKSQVTEQQELPETSNLFELTPTDSVRCLTEICYFSQKNWLKATNRGLRAADIRALALRLQLPESAVRATFEILVDQGLIQSANGCWIVSAIGEAWLGQDYAQRWLEVARLVVASAALPPAHDTPGSQREMQAQLRKEFPLIGPAAVNIVQSFAALGILSLGGLEPKLIGQFEKASSIEEQLMAIVHLFPSTPPKVIVQSDLSVLVTGPLTADLWQALNQLAQSQELGIASVFRITLASVTSALQSGWTIKAIEDFLAKQSGRAVPQPVNFLLRDAERRYGDLEVIAAPRGCSIVSRDSILIAQIQNEASLAELHLRTTDSTRLESPNPWRQVALALRAAGYPALMPKMQLPEMKIPTSSSEWIDAWVRAIRAGTQSDETTRAQLLQFALRDALPLQICYRGPQGEATVVVRVLGVTPQRIRCREIGREAELTLPQSSISSVTIAVS